MISTVILTHNSQKTIQDTLQSLMWCDEIIVIDDQSSDDTVSLVKKYTTQVFVHPLQDDFASQRNFGLSKAHGDWILFVDSDEVVGEGLKDEIQKIMSNVKCQSEEVVGYYLHRTDYMWGKELRHGETAHVKLLRLAKKNAGVWERPIHEVWNVQGKTETLVSPLFHYPHPDVAQFLKQIDRYSTLNAKYFYDNGVRVGFFDIFAYPVAKFFRNYFVTFGFLDGTAGIIVAFMMSFHSFLTRGKMWELQKNEV